MVDGGNGISYNLMSVTDKKKTEFGLGLCHIATSTTPSLKYLCL